MYPPLFLHCLQCVAVPMNRLRDGDPQKQWTSPCSKYHWLSRKRDALWAIGCAIIGMIVYSFSRRTSPTMSSPHIPVLRSQPAQQMLIYTSYDDKTMRAGPNSAPSLEYCPTSQLVVLPAPEIWRLFFVQGDLDALARPPHDLCLVFLSVPVPAVFQAVVLLQDANH